MLLRSQPLNSKISEKLAADSEKECEEMTEFNIVRWQSLAAKVCRTLGLWIRRGVSARAIY